MNCWLEFMEGTIFRFKVEKLYVGICGWLNYSSLPESEFEDTGDRIEDGHPGISYPD